MEAELAQASLCIQNPQVGNDHHQQHEKLANSLLRSEPHPHWRAKPATVLVARPACCPAFN